MNKKQIFLALGIGGAIALYYIFNKKPAPTTPAPSPTDPNASSLSSNKKRRGFLTSGKKVTEEEANALMKAPKYSCDAVQKDLELRVSKYVLEKEKSILRIFRNSASYPKMLQDIRNNAVKGTMMDELELKSKDRELYDAYKKCGVKIPKI